MKLKQGVVYEISHSRKGKFTAKVLEQDDNWTDILIVSGKTSTMNVYNSKSEGDTETIRTSFITSAVEVDCG